MFKYKEKSDALELTTVHGNKVTFLFKSETDSDIIETMIDEHPIDNGSDCQRGIFVSIGKQGFDADAKIMSIHELAVLAQKTYEETIKENEENERDAEEHDRYMSSLKTWGRI